MHAPNPDKHPVTPQLQAQIDRALVAWESLAEAKQMIYLTAEKSEDEWPPITHVPTGLFLIQGVVPDLIECEVSLRLDIAKAYLDKKPIEDHVTEADVLVRRVGQLLTVAGREMAAGRIGGADAQ